MVWQKIRRRIGRRIGAFGLLLLASLLLIALAPAAIAPYSPNERVGRPLLQPSRVHPLGTNDIGQDLLSELIWGTRVSLMTGLVVGVAAVLFGTLVGLLTGYYANLPSTLLLRLIDLTLVLPFLPLVVLLSAYLGPGQNNVMMILILVSWAAPARLIRSQVLSVLNMPFVEAAHALGATHWQIIRRHIWPSVRMLALLQFVLVSANSILAEASLSFLGLGDPLRKSWGAMLFFAQASGAFLSDAWLWWVLPPGVMISLSVMSLLLISYSLEQVAEPQLRRP